MDSLLICRLDGLVISIVTSLISWSFSGLVFRIIWWFQ